MSFDLSVFRLGVGAAEPAEIHAALCEGETPAGLVATPALRSFYSRLTKTYPELDDDADESPFAATIDRSPRALVISLSPSSADEVHAFIEAQAVKLGLDVYDPQVDQLFRGAAPGAIARTPPPPRLKRAKAESLFTVGLDGALGTLGFSRARPKRLNTTWVRITDAGVRHEIVLFESSFPMMEAGFGLATVKSLAAVLADGADPLAPTWETGLRRMFIGGWLPGRTSWSPAWDRKNGVRGKLPFEHCICSEACIERSVGTFTATVRRFLFPLLAELQTPAQLDAEWNRKTPRFPSRDPNATKPFWLNANRLRMACLHRAAVAREVHGVVPKKTKAEIASALKRWG